jgi:hypothetical protein
VDFNDQLPSLAPGPASPAPLDCPGSELAREPEPGPLIVAPFDEHDDARGQARRRHMGLEEDVEAEDPQVAGVGIPMRNGPHEGERRSWRFCHRCLDVSPDRDKRLHLPYRERWCHHRSMTLTGLPSGERSRLALGPEAR